MYKVLVTGGLGFIGSNLIHMLLNKKIKVINVDKVTYSSNFYNTKEIPKRKIINLSSVISKIKKKLTKY